MRIGVLLGMMLLGATAPDLQGQASRPPRTETVLFFLTAHSCPCNDWPEDFPQVVRQMKQKMADIWSGNDSVFVTVGVTIGSDVPEGVAYLLTGKTLSGRTVDLGKWDEIRVGRTFDSTSAVDLVWRRASAFPAYPQAIVVRRTIATRDGRMVATPDSVILELPGTDAMKAWLKSPGG